MEDLNPLAVILVSSGSRGDRLLFRYPDEVVTCKDYVNTYIVPTKNPYGVRIHEDLSVVSPQTEQEEGENPLAGYSDRVLSNLLAVKSGLCGRPCEVKINNVLFVGHPVLLHHGKVTSPSSKREAPTMMSFSVVFALRASCADETMIHCYQTLAKQLALALRHEERRCGYLDGQKNIMLNIQEEVTTATEDSMESPYMLMLQKSYLCRQLKTVYENLCTTGIVQLYINKWIHINFCLPHKVHSQQLPQDNQHISTTPENVRKAIAALKPYHAMLLLEEEESLLSSLPPDSSPSLHRLIRVTSHLKSLQILAADADIALGQVFQIVSHLVYWGKAVVIYPLSESNIYVLAPNTNIYVNSSLVEEFVENFPRMSLPAVLSEFSLPTSLREHRDALGLPPQQRQQVQMVVWLLRQRLLIQLHTYVFLLPGSGKKQPLSERKTLDMVRPVHSHQLSPLAEDPLVFSRKSTSVSDRQSVTSESSPNQSSMTPSVEIKSDGVAVTTEVREHWRLRDSLLANLTAEQRDCIQKVPATNNPDDLKLFARLYPYFNGKHHLEEIMYYENVRRSQLLTLLDKFRSVLICCQHEDPALCCWNKAPPSSKSQGT